MVILQTNFGDIVVSLDHTLTPLSAENFLTYVKKGFYDGTIFHRVINQFMIQGGGFESDMTRKKPLCPPVHNEAYQGKKNVRGTIAYARTTDPHSATSQFFINVTDNSFLDHAAKSSSQWGYCAFGKVIEGMEVVDKIRKVPTAQQLGYSDVPINPVVIEKAYVKFDNDHA